MPLKTMNDFESRNDFVDYLYAECKIGLPRELIYGRIGRYWNPEKAITTPKINKPGRKHPYKLQFKQQESNNG